MDSHSCVTHFSIPSAASSAVWRVLGSGAHCRKAGKKRRAVPRLGWTPNPRWSNLRGRRGIRGRIIKLQLVRHAQVRYDAKHQLLDSLGLSAHWDIVQVTE